MQNLLRRWMYNVHIYPLQTSLLSAAFYLFNMLYSWVLISIMLSYQALFAIVCITKTVFVCAITSISAILCWFVFIFASFGLYLFELQAPRTKLYWFVGICFQTSGFSISQSVLIERSQMQNSMFYFLKMLILNSNFLF